MNALLQFRDDFLYTSVVHTPPSGCKNMVMQRVRQNILPKRIHLINSWIAWAVWKRHYWKKNTFCMKVYTNWRINSNRNSKQSKKYQNKHCAEVQSESKVLNSSSSQNRQWDKQDIACSTFKDLCVLHGYTFRLV